MVQVLGLAHIDDIPRGVIIAVDSRGMWEQAYFLPDGQLLLGLDVPGNIGFDPVAAQVAVQDDAVRTHQHHVRDAFDAVQVGRDLLGVDDLVPGDAQFGGSLGGRGGLVPHGDAQHVEIFPGILVIHGPDVGDLCLAGTAPAGPEVDEHILALADIVGEPDGTFRLVVRILDNGEVDELLPGLGRLLGGEGAGDLLHETVLPDLVAQGREDLLLLFRRKEEDAVFERLQAGLVVLVLPDGLQAQVPGLLADLFLQLGYRLRLLPGRQCGVLPDRDDPFGEFLLELRHRILEILDPLLHGSALAADAGQKGRREP